MASAPIGPRTHPTTLPEAAHRPATPSPMRSDR